MGPAGFGPTVLRFGVFEVDLRSCELRKAGALIKLQSQPFKVLALLAQRPGQVVTREEIQRSLWGDQTFVDFERGINFSINQIRTALGDDAQRPRYVETLPRRGYRFVAPVERLESSLVSRAASSKAPVKPVRRAPAPYFIAFAAAVILAVAAGYLARRRFSPRTQVHAGNIRLAVLPFANFSGDVSQEYLSDGVTEEIITQLANLRPERLAVIARTSAMRYKHTNKSVDEIGRELGVDYVLEGSVRRVGDRMRISAQLIQANDQTHRWAKSYESEVRDILKVENDVARAIASNIELELTPQQQAHLATARPLNEEAYEAYLKGRYYWNKRTSADFKKGIGYFEQAIEEDSGYALAYAGLADSYALLGDYQFVPSGEAYPKARAAAMKALELEDTLAQAHTSLAFVMFEYDWDWQGAGREFRRAIELDPGYETGHHWYAYYLAAMGRVDESIAEIKRAQKLDPLSLIINRNLGWILYAAGQNDRAIEQLKKTLEMDSHFLPAHETLAWAYEQKGMYGEAAHESEQIAVISGNRAFAAALHHAYQVSGYHGVLRQRLENLRLRRESAYVSPLEEAYVYALLDDKDDAFQWLQTAYEQRVGVLVFLKVLPLFDPLRPDPRFTELCHRIGLQP